MAAAAELPILPSHRLRRHSPAEDSHPQPSGRCPAAVGVEREPQTTSASLAPAPPGHEVGTPLARGSARGPEVGPEADILHCCAKDRWSCCFAAAGDARRRQSAHAPHLHPFPCGLLLSRLHFQERDLPPHLPVGTQVEPSLSQGAQLWGMCLRCGLSFLLHPGATRSCSELIRELANMTLSWDRHGAQLRAITQSLPTARAAPHWRWPPHSPASAMQLWPLMGLAIRCHPVAAPARLRGWHMRCRARAAPPDPDLRGCGQRSEPCAALRIQNNPLLCVPRGGTLHPTRG